MRACLLLAFATAPFAFAPAAADPTDSWPEFHGPNRDNQSTATGLLKQWPAGGPKLLWRASGLGKGYSSVAVAGGRAYTAGKVGEETYVFALDAAGQHQWKAANGRAWKADPKRMRYALRFDGARGTPTVDDGLVYHLGEHGRLAALDAKTGQEEWALDMFGRFGATCPKYGLCESVVIDAGRLICCPGGSKAYMVALDKKTGAVLWTNDEIPGPVGYCSPVIVDYAGRRMLVTMSAKAVVGVDVDTGALLWSHPHGNPRNNSATDPVFHNGRVYATCGYGGGSVMVKLRAEAGRIRPELQWATKALDNHHGGVVLLDGHIYGSGHNAKGWFCLDFETGEQKYCAKGLGKGSLTYADGMLYVLSERGAMGLVRPTPDGHEVVSRFSLPRGGAGAYWPHPVVCGGRLYVRHADQLFVYRVAAEPERQAVPLP